MAKKIGRPKLETPKVKRSLTMTPEAVRRLVEIRAKAMLAAGKSLTEGDVLSRIILEHLEHKD